MKNNIDHKKKESVEHSISRESGHTSSNGSEIQQRIAMRAYELYRERGGIDGHDLDDWLAAEQTLFIPEATPEQPRSVVLE